MFVLDGSRGKNVGGKLVDEFIKWVKLKEVSKITVTASAKNVKVIGFYKKLGFEEYDLKLEKEV